MHVTVELCVVPMGVGVSVAEYVAACERVLREEGFDPDLHAYGTNFEGEWEEVMAAVRRCHEIVHDMGVPRIFTAMKIGTRTDRVQTLSEKVTRMRAFRQGPHLV